MKYIIDVEDENCSIERTKEIVFHTENGKEIRFVKTSDPTIQSAQPDTDEWCHDCKEYDQEKHCCPRWNRVIRETLKDARPEIIRCKDCIWFNSLGCAIEIRDDTDKPTEDDFCSFAESSETQKPLNPTQPNTSNTLDVSGNTLDALDLISRKAAIDVLLGITAMRNTIPLDSAIFNIRKLPSAQPEITLESAIDYLQSIGWMQEHDRILSSAQSDLSGYSDRLWKAAYERGKREGRADIVRCKGCIYYDPPHIEKDGVRYEYKEMPEDAFGCPFTGLVHSEYGINIGGRCCKDYNVGYSEDKRVFRTEEDFCSRAERRTDD